jgi:thioesterase domain-containing protein
VDILALGADRVVLSAPFESNRNGHGTLFGGSAVSIALLSGWLLVRRWVDETGIEADVVIHELDARFDAPIRGDVRSVATAPDAPARERFERTLRKRGRARIDVSLRVGSTEEGPGTKLVGRFVALAHSCAGAT